MDNQRSSFKEKFKTLGWAFKTAWGIDKKNMLIWYGLSAILAVLPAVALSFNKQTLSIISGFLSGVEYMYSDVVPAIIALGALMTVIGLSARVNVDLIYMMMYDKYYVGFMELIMESIQRVEMTDLLKKDVNNAYNYTILRAGSLTDLISGSCAIISKIVSIVSLLIVAFTTSKLIFFMSIIYVVVIFIINFSFNEKTRYYSDVRLKENRIIEYYERLSENKGMAKESRIYENTDEIVRQWEKPFLRVQKNEDGRALASELRNFVSGTGFYIFLIITMGLSLFSVANSKMTPDVFLVLFTLCLNIYKAINGMAGDIYTFDYGLYAMNRQRIFFEIAPFKNPEEENNKLDEPHNEETVFNVKNLCFSYTPDKPIIKDITFTVNKGEIIALVGQNGSGKTTLIKLLLNMYKPNSGVIEVFGRPYKDYKSAFIRSKLGVFFQDFFIFHQTMRENVAAGGIENLDNEIMINDAIKKGGAEKVVKQLKNGLDTLLGKFMDKSGTELSGGERQRVGVSRTHMNNKEVLIFDEPASMLDPIAEMEQFVNIKGMLDGRTAILISHRVGFARIADKIIMLNNGEIAETGTHQELMSLNGLYAHFFNEQAQWYETSGASTGKGS